MSIYDYTRAQRVAHRQIVKFAGGFENNGRLDRGGVLRNCTVAIIDYRPQERDGNLIQWTDRRGLLSPVGLTTDPDSDRDFLIFGKYIAGVWTQLEKLRIAAPPGKLAPAGTVVFWDLQLREP